MENELTSLIETLKELLGNGEPTFEIRKQIQLYHLNQSKHVPYEVIVNLNSTSDCCENCKKLSQKSLSIEQAYKEMPLPNPNCTSHYGCRCRYTLIPKRDKEGRIILKSK